LALALASGCPKPPPASPPVPREVPSRYEEPPRLAAPERDRYGLAPDAPRDPLVAEVVGDAPWDAALAGAAGQVALRSAQGDPLPAPWQLRETLYRAGWPHGAADLRRWPTPTASPPPSEAAPWLERARLRYPATALARARGPVGDVWVAIAAEVGWDPGVMPKRYAAGDALDLPSAGLSGWSACDPDGRLRQGGPADTPPRLDVEGEWLIHLESGPHAVTFPVWVALPPSHDTLLTAAPPGPPDEQVLALLARVRDAFGLHAPARDPYLDAAAADALAHPERPIAEVTRAWPQEGLEVLRCQEASVEACVDAWAWSVRGRAGILSPTRAVVGVAARAEGGRVRAVALLGPEPAPLNP
jgi:hypothetical protein